MKITEENIPLQPRNAGNFSTGHMVAGGIPRAAPPTKNTHNGFSVQCIKTGKTALALMSRKINRIFINVFRAFRLLVASKETRLRMMAIAQPTPERQREYFQEVRKNVIDEVRKRNAAVFQKELGLAGAQWSAAMKILNRIYDRQSASDFAHAHDALWLSHENPDQAAARLWQAHADAMPLLGDAQADWLYSGAMHALSHEVDLRLAERSGIERPASMDSQRSDTSDYSI